jgi:hypothetical protein
MFIANHQEVITVCVQQLLRVVSREGPSIPSVGKTSVPDTNVGLPERQSSVNGRSCISVTLLLVTLLTQTVSCRRRTLSVILGAPKLGVESEQTLVAAVLQHRSPLSLCDDVSPTHLLNVCGTPSLDRPESNVLQNETLEKFGFVNLVAVQ